MQQTTPRRSKYFNWTHVLGIIILAVIFFNLFPITHGTPEWYVAVHDALGQVGQGLQSLYESIQKSRGK